MDNSKAYKYNPYDFANPVIDPKLFAGRKDELEEIDYYLNQARAAPRAINLALIGDRASGKTSLLNMIESGAKQRGFCTVRIDLDESDAESPLVLFLKLFDGVITSACMEGAFGGIHGKTFEVYRNMIDAHELPDDKTFCSFIFPMQYAKAMQHGNYLAPVSDSGFKDDISKIQSDISRPIAILIDECDTLAKSRVQLEKLRNIFMNLHGFLLVFTGTGTFFPLMNEVFSPIIRQFKKIDVKPFENERETKDCVEKPLRALGIQTEEVFDRDTYREIESIHTLSGGRPYEIQLICHHLFKRLQLGKASKLELSVDVLDDVLTELQSIQDINVRPVVQQIRGLTKDELRALNVLLKSSGAITFEQAWYLEYVFNSGTSWTKEKLSKYLDILISKNLVKIEKDCPTFVGDDFDRLYCKYYSRKFKTFVSIGETSFSLRLRLNIYSKVSKSLPCISPYLNDWLSAGDRDLERSIASFSSWDADFVDTNPEFAERLYTKNLEKQGCPSFPLVLLDVNTPWEKATLWYTVQEKDSECDSDKCGADFERVFRDANQRASEYASHFAVRTLTVPVIPVEALASTILSGTSHKLRTNLCRYHMSEMIEYYVRQKERERAKYHGDFAYRYSPEPEDAEIANDLGYMYMSFGNLDRAQKLFQVAQARLTGAPIDAPFLDQNELDNKQKGQRALVLYNSGVAFAMNNQLDEAQECIARGVQESEKMGTYECACLFAAVLSENGLEFTEVYDPDLLITARDTLEKLQRYRTSISESN